MPRAGYTNRRFKNIFYIILLANYKQIQYVETRVDLKCYPMITKGKGILCNNVGGYFSIKGALFSQKKITHRSLILLGLNSNNTNSD